MDTLGSGPAGYTAAIYAAEADKGTYTTDSKDKLVVRSIRRVR